jgi:Ni/Co efflux regulator RcnB
MMKKILLSLAAVAALAGSEAPAAAQPFDHRGPNGLEWRIRQGERSGQLTSREAYRLRGELRATERLAARYRADGVVTRWERRDLDRRYASISTQVRYQRHDREYGAGYGNRW